MEKGGRKADDTPVFLMVYRHLLPFFLIYVCKNNILLNTIASARSLRIYAMQWNVLKKRQKLTLTRKWENNTNKSTKITLTTVDVVRQ